MILLLTFFTLCFETYISYKIFDKSFCSPAFIFCAGFTLASADLLTMVDYWKVDLHWNTYYVITGGCLVFILISFAVKKALRSFKLDTKGISLDVFPTTRNEVNISKFMLLCVLAFNALSIMILSYKVISVIRSFGMYTGILSSFGKYAAISKFSNRNVSLGFLNNLMLFLRAEGYIFGNLVVVAYFKNKKIDFLLLLCFVSCVISTFITGSRGGSIYMILSLVPSVYLCREKKILKKPIKAKYVILLGLLGFGSLFLLQLVGSVMGRTMKEEVSPWAYISIYLGAPIQNLDYFLQQSHEASKVFGGTTFYYQIQYYAVGHNRLDLIYDFDLPFVKFNNHNAGNVYTIFYAFFYDFGYKGVVILTGLMALMIQTIYEYTLKSIRKPFSISRLFYMYMFPTIPLSFFSNKFYEGLTIAFVKMIIFWIILYLALIQDKYKLKKR